MGGIRSVGGVIARRLKARGLSPRALARKAGLRPGEWKEIESGRLRPERFRLERIARALGTSAEELQAAAGEVPPALRSAYAGNSAKVVDFLRSLEEPTESEGRERGEVGIEKSLRPVYETRLGRLYQDDCLRVMKSLAPASVDCVFADPPFNLAKDYGDGIDDSLEDGEYLDWSIRWIDEAIRLLKPGGAFFLWNLPKWNLRLGAYVSDRLRFRHWIAVDIKYSLPISGRLYPSHYSLLYFVKGRKPKAFSPPRLPMETCRHCGGELKDYGGYKDRMNPNGINLTDVWTDIPPVRHRRYKNRRANELALKVLDRILDIATREGDLVLDPFGGSGTTYAACELRGRRWIGCELGDAKPIIARLSDLSEERDRLRRIRARLNVLFTEDVLRLRRKCGHDTSRYRLAVKRRRPGDALLPRDLGRP